MFNYIPHSINILEGTYSNFTFKWVLGPLKTARGVNISRSCLQFAKFYSSENFTVHDLPPSMYCLLKVGVTQ